MLVQTVRFGELEIKDTSIIHFVSPILGFEEERKFVFIPSSDEDSHFIYLQSIEDANLAFVLADPFPFYTGYEFDIEDKWIQKLKLDAKEDVEIRVVTTVRSPQDISVNLKAPIIINRKNNDAAQIILDNSRYTTRHSLFSNPSQGGE
ncbi:flagellar assembly protein FliW [Paenibacillus massiliensis]|uniref:flagellar assembly protein FliW n=1 Tax=Paenibacillus massiliensis TaxID=225917 RepID=UPI0004113EB1|nr:flagellar assembly protein FliW [Paenibacillus massiliensis]